MKRLISFAVALSIAMAALMCCTALAEEWICPTCGTPGTGNFCTECGTPKPVSGEWTCPGCGQTGNTGKFCPICGTQRPDDSQMNPQTPTVYVNTGLEQIPGETNKVKLILAGVDASAYYTPAANPDKWLPWNAVDGNQTTCWQHYGKDGEWLQLDIAPEEAVDEIWFKNGFWAYNTNGKDQYSINARLKKVTVQFLYYGESKYRDGQDLVLKDEWGYDWQRFELGHHENVSSVRIVIHSHYEGSEKSFRHDVCLSEVMLVQYAPAESALPAQAEGEAVVYESRPEITGCTLKKKLATRAGPSTKYKEPGTFFGKNNSWKNQTVKVLKKSFDGNIWWVQVDFQNGSGGKRYRVWTGAEKRVNVDLNLVKEEIPIGECDIVPTSDTRWGPGTEYKEAKITLKTNAIGVVYEIENGYADVEYYCDDGATGRVWVPRSAVVSIDTNKDHSGEN